MSTSPVISAARPRSAARTTPDCHGYRRRLCRQADLHQRDRAGRRFLGQGHWRRQRLRLWSRCRREFHHQHDLPHRRLLGPQSHHGRHYHFDQHHRYLDAYVAQINSGGTFAMGQGAGRGTPAPSRARASPWIPAATPTSPAITAARPASRALNARPPAAPTTPSWPSSVPRALLLGPMSLAGTGDVDGVRRRRGLQRQCLHHRLLQRHAQLRLAGRRRHRRRRRLRCQAQLQRHSAVGQGAGRHRQRVRAPASPSIPATTSTPPAASGHRQLQSGRHVRPHQRPAAMPTSSSPS